MSYALNEKRVGKEAVNLVGRLLRKWIWKQNWVSSGILLLSCKEWHPVYSEVLCQYFWTCSGPHHIYDVCLLLQFTPKHCSFVTLTLRWLMSYIYAISILRDNDLTLIMLTWRKSWANNASK
jgi:hypothetical protein